MNPDNGYKMLFCTGVRPHNHLNKEGELIKLPFEVWKGGILHIEYFLETEPPEGSTLLYLCDNPNPQELNNTIAIPIIKGGMSSRYAIFRKNKKDV